MTTPPTSPKTHKPLPSASPPTPPHLSASIPLGLPPRPPTSSSLECFPTLTRASTPPILLTPKAIAAGGGTKHGDRGGECCEGACSGFELIAKLAIDHQEAFPAEQENGKSETGKEEGGEEGGGGAAAAAAAPFATVAEGRRNSPPSALPFLALPREVLRDACSYLRAWDLSALVQTCRALGDEAESGVVEEVALHSLDLLSFSSSPPSLPASASSSTASSGNGTALGGATPSSFPSSPPALSSSTSSSSSHKDGSGPGLGVLLERLRYQEIQHVHRLLSLPEPLAGGYYVSKAWLSNHRRFAEALSARRKAALLQQQQQQQHGGREGGEKDKPVAARRRNSRERRESEVSVPWSEVNADITCIHGSLMPLQRQPSSSPSLYSSSPPSHPHSSSSSSSASSSFSCPLSLSGSGLLMGKRKTIEKRAWKALRRFYPEGKAFKVSTTEECPQCSRKDREEKERLEEERKIRDSELAASPTLTTLFARRTGCPPSSLAAASSSSPASTSSSSTALPAAAAVAAAPAFLPPLDPGLYHLLPRCWLTAWRNYIRDPKAPRPRAPDLSLLLCEAHGFPLIPPHISSFLDGEKKGVLSSLNGRSGVVCEIVSVDEWEELMKIFPTDYCLKFSVDPEDLSIAWSTPPCERCEPGVDDLSVTYRNRQRKWSF